MLKKNVLLLSILVPLSAAAQDALSPPLADAAQVVVPARVSMLSPPSIDPVQQAFFASGMKSAKPVLAIDYDAEGVPLKLALDPASGNETLDQAILAWGRQLRLTPGKAGTGRVPFDFSAESDEASPSPNASGKTEVDLRQRIVKTPSMQSLQQAFSGTNLSHVSTELLIDYDAEGNVVGVRLSSPTKSGALDKALLQWGKQLRLMPGAAGSGRLPIKIESH
jgi:hypothetical protein